MPYRLIPSLLLSLTLTLRCKPKESIPQIRPADAVILCFHDVGRTGRYAIGRAVFAAILDDLKPFRVVSVNKWIANVHATDERPQVVLTFDDGYSSHREIVLPELLKRGYGATFFFYNGQLLHDKKWSRLLKTLPANFDLGSHSWSHSSLSASTDHQLFRELFLAREHLAGFTGKPAESFAWPYGAWTDTAARAARAAGFKYLFSVDYRIARAADLSGVIPRYTVMGSRSREQVRSILGQFAKAAPVR